MRLIEGIAVALVLSLPPLAFACSSSNNDTPPPADAGSDVADETPDQTDAGPDIEQPEDIYPAQHADIPQLDNLGGPVLDHLKLVTVTFYHQTGDAGAPDPDAGDGGVPGRTSDQWKGTLRSFGDFIVKSDWWHKTMQGYGVSDGTGGLYGELDDTPVASKSISDQDIQAVLQAGVDSGDLPPPEAQMLYAVYFPQSTQISNFGSSACADFLGYHGEMAILVKGSPVDVSYAVMPRCKADTVTATLEQLTVTASHEFAEAASDPFPETNGAYRMVTNDAWVPPLGLGSAGNENGDVCIFAPNYDESGWKVQPIWSNAAAKASQEPCEPQPVNADPIYFQAAVKTDQQKINGRNKYGYVVVPKGTSVDVVVNVFSTAKLPHDLTLFTGVDKGTGDPTDMKEISNGITATLSRQQVHNGNGVVMTVSVPAAGVSGDFRFVVRSVLEQTDYHDWPVIVNVPK
jgi:hypothetical protein